MNELEIPRLKLVEDAQGDLRIWDMPEDGKKYVIGADTSGGTLHGDPAAAVVVETLTRSMVASWTGKYPPKEWGRLLCYLGWFYNTAMIGVETRPSQHGLTTALECQRLGYPLLYRRMEEGMVTHQMSKELGWASTTQTKGLMVGYVRDALASKYEIPCMDLLLQLSKGRRKEDGKMKFDGHDDYYTAFAIALRIAELMVERGFVSDERPEPRSFEEAWWRDRKLRLDLGVSEEAPMRAWDGL